MTPLIPIAFTAAAALVVLLASSSKRPPSGPPFAPTGPNNEPRLDPVVFPGNTNIPRPHGLSDVRQMMITIGAPREWQDFYVLVAAGESRGNIDVGLGITANAPPWVDMHTGSVGDKEARAAAKAYSKNASTYAGCWPAEAYGFGSGGWWAMLPANALAAFKNTALVCLHPWTIFDGKISTIMAAWYGRRLSQWKQWNGTVLSLRVGWGDPSAMNKADVLDAKRSKFEQDCHEADLDPSFLDQKLKRWKPKPATELFDLLGADRGWLPAT